MNKQPRAVYEGTVLLVADAPVNLRLLTQMLTKHGYKTRAVNSGERALLAVQASLPDVILLDIMMKGMDGYEVCERLKADERTRDIPIIFISALDAVDDRIKAFAVGGVDYITRPFQIKEVMARVQTHMSLRKMQEQLEISNAELDAYDHTVAHSLRSSLDGVAGPADWLLTSYETMSQQDIVDCVQSIAHGSGKMADIVNNLLLLASIRKGEVDPQPLDMGQSVAQAQRRLAQLIEQRQAQFVLPPEGNWPRAVGHGPWVEEIWANYISNAIKYGGEPPRVELGFDESASQRINESTQARSLADGSTEASAELSRGLAEVSQIRFWVRDNGPGLTTEEQEQLFTPFTRLQSARRRARVGVVHRTAHR